MWSAVRMVSQKWGRAVPEGRVKFSTGQARGSLLPQGSRPHPAPCPSLPMGTPGGKIPQKSYFSFLLRGLLLLPPYCLLAT